MSNNTAALLLRDTKMPVNPFTDAYWKAEIEAYGLKNKLFHVEHVRVELQSAALAIKRVMRD